MTPPRVVLILLAVLTAVLLQPGVVKALPLPVGSPQLVVVVVVAIALVEGPTAGSLAGFLAGLLADLTSSHAVGRDALVLTVAGMAAGLARDRGESALGELGAGFVIVVTVVISAAVAVADAAVGVVVGDGSVGVRLLVRVSLSAAAYDAVIVLLVYPPVRAALSRLDPTRTA